MKRIILSFCIISLALFPSFAQNKKAVRDSIALVKFQKAITAIDAKDFVIIAETYETGPGNYETNTDEANFLSYEKELVFLQGQIIAANSYTNKLNVSDYKQETDKRGNINVYMQVRGFFITANVNISLKKGSSYADVIITPSKGDIKRFSGEVVPRAESKYFKRSGAL